ncbi:hypothetical protein [Methylovorus sp. MP688]|uniref:hypothetical protein n=1 Tax=Methylovorus sp. (strain MP688) TaxID=887061 RepID=UPI0011D0F760|nr:hypothetical protein [Methylovorus sp. MP688]
MLPFVNELPYLHYLTFWQRTQVSFLIFIISYFLMWLGATSKNRKASARMGSGIKNQIGKWLGFCYFIFSGALFNANVMGLLVLHTVPTQPYLEEMCIDKVKYQGKKSKSIYLTLHSEANGETYYLTLAEKLFIYPRFEAGDKMILKGQQNIFGVYVEKFDLGPV